jgi:hypothetical protein
VQRPPQRRDRPRPPSAIEVHRYYDPQTGEFLTVDAIVDTTLSAYGYASGDPLNVIDPSGDVAAPPGSLKGSTFVYTPVHEPKTHVDIQAAPSSMSYVLITVKGPSGPVIDIKAATPSLPTHVSTPVDTGGGTRIDSNTNDGATDDKTGTGDSTADSTDVLPTQVQGNTGRLTNEQARELAKYLGYRPTNIRSHGEIVFTNGKTYITQDADSHQGGTWKIASSPADLGSRSTRTATTDALLNPIGD